MKRSRMRFIPSNVKLKDKERVHFFPLFFRAVFEILIAAYVGKSKLRSSFSWMDSQGSAFVTVSDLTSTVITA